MSEVLPANPDLDWYKKAAKQRLREWRADNPTTRLAEAQLSIARENGFSSWRELKGHISRVVELPRLFESIQRRDHDATRKLLKKRPDLARLSSTEGLTAIHVAAESNNTTAIELLVRHKANPKTYFGKSAHNALSWALTVGSLDAARALVRNGLQPDFFCAAGLGDLDRLRSFFDANGKLAPSASQTGSSRWLEDGTRIPAPPSTSLEQISDALYFASRNGQVEAVTELLARGPDLSFRSFYGGTALHWAYCSGNQQIVDLLLRAGADPTLRDYEMQCTPRAFGVCVASLWGFPVLLHRVLQMDSSVVNIFEGRGTPLHEAVRGGNPRIVQTLLLAGADPSIRDLEGNTSLDLAKAGKHADVVEVLERHAGHGASDTTFIL